jgi:hypothetical protein
MKAYDFTLLSPLIFSFSMRSVSYQRKVSDWFFTELVYLYGLFNDAVSSTYYVKLNGRIIHEQWIGKETVVGYFKKLGIATGYGLDGRGVGVQVPVGARFFPTPQRPDLLR